MCAIQVNTVKCDRLSRIGALSKKQFWFFGSFLKSLRAIYNRVWTYMKRHLVKGNEEVLPPRNNPKEETHKAIKQQMVNQEMWWEAFVPHCEEAEIATHVTYPCAYARKYRVCGTYEQ